MIALDLPPKLILPAPAIIRPAEHKLLRPNYLPANREQRRAALRELLAHGAISREEAKRAIVFFCPPMLPTSASYPTVVNTNTGTYAAGSPWAVNLPASIVAGNLLLLVLTSVENVPSATPSGWTQLSGLGGSGEVVLYTYYKTASGSEGSTVNVTNAGIRVASSVCFQISGWGGTPEVTTIAHGTSTTPDPASITPSWGALPTLFILGLGIYGTQSVSANPTNYGNAVEAYQSSGLSNRTVTVRREATTTTEDPDAFTLSGTPTSRRVQTIAIKSA